VVFWLLDPWGRWPLGLGLDGTSAGVAKFFFRLSINLQLFAMKSFLTMKTLLTMKSSFQALLVASGLGAAAFLLAAPALAHHPMAFLEMQPGPVAGIISGLMHPVLGPDHLLFLLAIGLVAIKRPLWWVGALLACGLLGSALGLVAPGFSAVEPLVALSVALVGLVLLRRLPAGILLPAFVLHGYALSASVIGWEPTPIGFYLVGLLISQAALLLVSITAIRRWAQAAAPQALNLTYGLLMGMGLAFTWSALVP
jgi:urease accessory protein